MKGAEFYRWCDSQMPDEPHADVVAIDEDGFVHAVDELFWDPEYARWVIRTKYKEQGET